MRELWLAISLILSLGWLFWAGNGIFVEKKKLETKAELKRLSKVTLQIFARGRPPAGEEFWRAVGLEKPILDPWGTPFRLTTPEPERMEWRSAGSDRFFDTSDDLVLKVPYGSSLQPDLSPSDGQELGRPATDVR